MQKPLENPIFQFASRFTIQVDSFLTACTCTVLENWLKSMTKTGVYIPLFFLAKTVTTKIWFSGVLDYSNKNDNWTVTLLSHIALMLQYYFFFTSIDYNKEKTSHSKKDNQSTKEVWLRCMSDREWHDITRYNLIMLQKSMKKLYNITFISHHFSIKEFEIRIFIYTFHINYTHLVNITNLIEDFKITWKLECAG